MLKRLQVEHYKSIEYLDMEFGPVTALVGANGSGKSNVIDVLSFLKDCVTAGPDAAISKRQGIDSIRQWSPIKPYQIKISVEFETEQDDVVSSTYSLVIGSSKKNKNFYIIEEKGQLTSNFFALNDDDELVDQLEYREFKRDRSGKINVNSQPLDVDIDSDELFISERYEARYFSQLRRLLKSVEIYSIFPNTIRHPESLSNSNLLSAHGDNLCSILKKLSKTGAGKEARAEITEAMRKVMPSLDEIKVKSAGSFLTPVFLVSEEEQKGHEFNVSQLSDGTLRVLGTLLALYHPGRPDIIALEEPELTVNPAILGVLVDSIKEVSASSQILITTHSPELVDMLKPEEIRAVAMEAGVTTVKPIADHQKKSVKEGLFTLGELMVTEGLFG